MNTPLQVAKGHLRTLSLLPRASLAMAAVPHPSVIQVRNRGRDGPWATGLSWFPDLTFDGGEASLNPPPAERFRSAFGGGQLALKAPMRAAGSRLSSLGHRPRLGGLLFPEHLGCMWQVTGCTTTGLAMPLCVT